MHGKPTIRGLRYTVESILELLSSGMAIEEILYDYEDLERDDILAALDFARQLQPDKTYRVNCGMKFLIDAQLPRHFRKELDSNLLFQQFDVPKSSKTRILASRKCITSQAS